jgi:hypothetical protein
MEDLDERVSDTVAIAKKLSRLGTADPAMRAGRSENTTS